MLLERRGLQRLLERPQECQRKTKHLRQRNFRRPCKGRVCDRLRSIPARHYKTEGARRTSRLLPAARHTVADSPIHDIHNERRNEPQPGSTVGGLHPVSRRSEGHWQHRRKIPSENRNDGCKVLGRNSSTRRTDQDLPIPGHRRKEQCSRSELQDYGIRLKTRQHVEEHKAERSRPCPHICGSVPILPHLLSSLRESMEQQSWKGGLPNSRQLCRGTVELRHTQYSL